MTSDDDRIGYLMDGAAAAGLDRDERDDIDALRAMLGDVFVWDEPREDLGDNVVALIAAEAASTGIRPGGKARARRLSRLGAAVLGAAAASVVAVGVVQIRDSTSTRSADATIPLAGTALEPSASGRADITSTTSGLQIEFRVDGLPRRDGNDFYEAWLKSIDGTRLVPVGTFHDGDKVTLWAGVTLADYPILTVTRESAAGPKDAAQGSSMQIVVSGTVMP